MLARLMPDAELPASRRPMPWDVIPWDPTIHLGLFVHRVDGLEPGLYLLVRDPCRMGRLRAAMHARFEWSTPPGCPAELPLRLLEAGDVRRLATQVSCHQDIAGDGAFSLAMIAEYQETLFTRGAWFYRRLFWETGLIGQVLYLEAEAAGVMFTLDTESGFATSSRKEAARVPRRSCRANSVSRSWSSKPFTARELIARVKTHIALSIVFRGYVNTS
jgi:hypothetical protein